MWTGQAQSPAPPSWRDTDLAVCFLLGHPSFTPKASLGAVCTTRPTHRTHGHGGACTHPRGLDLVARGAHPAGVVGQRLALLSLQAGLHLTPPLPDHYGGCARAEARVCNSPAAGHRCTPWGLTAPPSSPLTSSESLSGKMRA